MIMQERVLRLTEKFQFRMMRRAGLPVTVSALAALGGIYFVTDPLAGFEISDYRWIGIIGLAGLYIITMSGIVWSLFLYSSRLSGPLVGLRKTLQVVADGDLTARLKVRKNDELHEQAEHLNKTIISLQDRVKRINQFCKYTHTALEQMREKGENPESLDHLLGLVRSIEESVHDFKVE